MDAPRSVANRGDPSIDDCCPASRQVRAQKKTQDNVNESGTGTAGYTKRQGW